MTKGTRIPQPFQPSPDLMRYASDVGVADVQRMLEDFTDHWVSCAGARGVKLDWSATWRKWARTQGDKDREKAAREMRYRDRYAAPAHKPVRTFNEVVQRFHAQEQKPEKAVVVTPEEQELYERYQARKRAQAGAVH